MAEKVVVRQGRNYVTSFMASDPEAAASEPVVVQRLNDLTPYGMVLAGLGTCTAFVVNTYAEHHGLPVDAVVLTLEYQRSFPEDCKHCTEIEKYEERIRMLVAVEGVLSPEQKEKLFKIAMHCPVHKMLLNGIEVKAEAG